MGSGKTSVLLLLAKYLVQLSHSKKNDTKVVIIENEIGSVGVDNLLLENADYVVKNVFAGCACCTSSGQLTDTVRFLSKEYSPDWILIEATGLANPSKIKSAVETELDLKALAIAIVDAKRWFRLVNAMETFVSEQLEDAFAVLVNKIDMVDDVTVAKVMEGIRKYNQDARSYPISAVSEILNGFWEDLIKGATI